MAKKQEHIAILKPTPREFVRLWNQVRQALEKQLASSENVSCPTVILSLQYTPELMQKVELVVARFANDEDNYELVKDVRLSVCYQDEFVNIVLKSMARA
jgi:hypothetical protein